MRTVIMNVLLVMNPEGSTPENVVGVGGKPRVCNLTKNQMCSLEQCLPQDDTFIWSVEP